MLYYEYNTKNVMSEVEVSSGILGVVVRVTQVTDKTSASKRWDPSRLHCTDSKKTFTVIMGLFIV